LNKDRIKVYHLHDWEISFTANKENMPILIAENRLSELSRGVAPTIRITADPIHYPKDLIFHYPGEFHRLILLCGVGYSGRLVRTLTELETLRKDNAVSPLPEYFQSPQIFEDLLELNLLLVNHHVTQLSHQAREILQGWQQLADYSEFPL